MTLNPSFKKLSIITIVCTILITFSSMGIFTDKASASQPGHTLVRVETKVVATDPNSADNDVALLIGIAGLVPALQGINQLAKFIAIAGFGLSFKTWYEGLDAAPNSFTVKKYIYKSDEIKNNNYWGYYYTTVTNGNTGETVTSRTFPIGKTA
ncbi:hypothetical protein V7183_24485 [Bacillus sp. JJ1127]|uniref:hypothetical protein n=1 Tax=Bacillus sp. JJ1127 TaxID=3122952 RepID=UPI002FFE465E